MRKELGKRKKTSCSTVSVPEKRPWKTPNAGAIMGEGEKTERQCTVHKTVAFPVFPPIVSKQVLCHPVRTWRLPPEVLGFWVGANGRKPREKERRPHRQRNTTTRTRHKMGCNRKARRREQSFRNLLVLRGSWVGTDPVVTTLMLPTARWRVPTPVNKWSSSGIVGDRASAVGEMTGLPSSRSTEDLASLAWT